MDAKQKILSALKEILLTEGHHAVSVRKVAAAAGVNHGLVHHYFGSKEKMLCAAIEDLAHRKFSQFARDVANSTAEDLSGALSKILITDVEFSRLLNEFVVLAADLPLLRKALAKTVESRRDLLMKLFNFDLPEATAFQAALIGAQFIKNIMGPDYIESALPILQRQLVQRANPSITDIESLLHSAKEPESTPSGEENE
ncbi:MAG: TetR/AcrR family transcriptional regulator [bacterium]|nr:TetR/AcrR family transcriptional regulator [bacterium]